MQHTKFLTLLCALILVFFAFSAQADQPSLQHGINLSSWFANAPRQPLYDQDFKTIQQAGFDFVRLPVNPAFFGFNVATPNADNPQWDLAVLDKAIHDLNADGLAVVLDVHPNDEFKQSIEKDDAAAAKFVDYWATLATRYKDVPTTMLAYEILNEPQYYNNPDHYNQLAAQTVKRIRTIDTEHLIIVGAPAVMSTLPIDSVKELTPIADPHIAYDVHFYKPLLFTHQGTPVGFNHSQIRFIHNVPYPSAGMDKKSVVIDTGADPSKAMNEVDDYIHFGWDRSTIASFLTPIAIWGLQNHVRILVLEFGALRNIDPKSRYAWISDTRQILETLHLGWAVWDYSDLFGITTLKGETKTDPTDGSIRFVHPESGVRVFDADAIKALGLITVH